MPPVQDSVDRNVINSHSCGTSVLFIGRGVRHAPATGGDMGTYRKSLIDELVRTAERVRLQAYAPYSKFMVGAAILTSRRNIFAGCNVESADYDGTHAEEAALAAMVAAGERSPRLLVVIGALEGSGPSIEDPGFTGPCGKCRQKLMEFSSLCGHDLQILERSRKPGVYKLRRLSELLPASFGPANIGVDLKKYRR